MNRSFRCFAGTTCQWHLTRPSTKPNIFHAPFRPIGFVEAERILAIRDHGRIMRSGGRKSSSRRVQWASHKFDVNLFTCLLCDALDLLFIFGPPVPLSSPLGLCRCLVAYLIVCCTNLYKVSLTCGQSFIRARASCDAGL